MGYLLYRFIVGALPGGYIEDTVSVARSYGLVAVVNAKILVSGNVNP
jgi:hypothetical protein